MKQIRQFVRIHWLIPCMFQAGEIYGWGVIRNISVQGAELATRFHLSANSEIKLRFRVGRQNHFKNLKAQVLQTRKSGAYQVCGLQFSDHTDHMQIEKAVNSLLAEQLEEI